MLGAQKRRLLMWGCDGGHAARPLIFKKVPPYRKQTSYLQEDASVEEALELDMPRNCSMLTTNGPSATGRVPEAARRFFHESCGLRKCTSWKGTIW